MQAVTLPFSTSDIRAEAGCTEKCELFYTVDDAGPSALTHRVAVPRDRNELRLAPHYFTMVAVTTILRDHHRELGVR